jgi:hypothetical protein
MHRSIKPRVVIGDPANNKRRILFLSGVVNETANKERGGG